MIITLRNVGDAMRVVYDRQGKIVSIPIGQDRRIDLNEPVIERMRSAQSKGDSLRILTVTGADASTLKLSEPLEPKSSLDALVLAESMDYFTLLATVERLVPSHGLGLRPKREQMLKTLRASSVRDQSVIESKTAKATPLPPQPQPPAAAPVAAVIDESARQSKRTQRVNRSRGARR
jgi:hypothetical protein